MSSLFPESPSEAEFSTRALRLASYSGGVIKLSSFAALKFLGFLNTGLSMKNAADEHVNSFKFQLLIIVELGQT